MSTDQFHFEFSEWEDAFATYYRKHCGERIYGEDGRYLGKRQGDPSIMLLISTAPETSGYWIERDAEPDDSTGSPTEYIAAIIEAELGGVK